MPFDYKDLEVGLKVLKMRSMVRYCVANIRLGGIAVRVSIYAAEYAGLWKIWISLFPAVDRLWWSGAGGEGWNNRPADKLVWLDSCLPLGWAVKLREQFQSDQGMRHWPASKWAAYINDLLKTEIWMEEEAGGRACGEWFRDVEIINEPLIEGGAEEKPGPQWRGKVNGMEVSGGKGSPLMQKSEVLSIAAKQLVGALSGRSLLEAELEAMLAERYAEAEGEWKAAAQLAHLRGGLQLEAAVGTSIEGAVWKGDRNKRYGRKRNDSPNSGIMGNERESSGCKRRRGRVCLAGIAEGVSRAFAAAALLLRKHGAARRRAGARCLRCGSVATGRTPCAACGLAGCAYCEACLALGRSRACALLLRSAASPAVRCTAGGSPAVAARRWGLSAAQAGAAGAALGFLAEPRQRSAASSPERFLLWAVTGAGKTEITFPLLEAVLAAGGRALVATPRRDVVLELAPRLARAFPAETLAVLYGGSADRWASGQLTLATTHQLLRFHQSFDLVIIDELDAYPYHNDPMLAFAAEHACKPGGSFIYLSATPPEELQRLARSGKLPHARVPVRFHGHPLPVPQHLEVSPLHMCLKRGALPAKLLQALRKSFAREAQIFLFVSRIAHIDRLLVLLRQSFPEAAMEGTSSQDPARTEKVAAFRSRSISLLVTTTILERGVTVPRSDVLILDADSSLFDEASLVQMAGRTGRSKEDPAGTVIFLSPQWTKSQRGAVSQIRTMNTIARTQGYIRKEVSL
ncbi:Transcription-repair-coupling factor [compost metagenome]